MRDETRKMCLKIFECCDELFSKIVKAPFGNRQIIKDALDSKDEKSIMKYFTVFFNEIKALLKASVDQTNTSPLESKVEENQDYDHGIHHLKKHQNINNIQITANNDEIARRMQAFIQRKQLEVDAFNSREFCKILGSNKDSSCARTDAAYIQRRGKKSIVEVTKVDNEERDETELRPPLKRLKNDCVWTPSHPSTALNIEFLPPELDERITAMETHLKLNKSGTANKALHHRISELESRILYLEGLSSEYFNGGNQSMLQQFPLQDNAIATDSNSAWQDAALDSIDDRISFLKKRLLEKKSNLINKTERDEDVK